MKAQILKLEDKILLENIKNRIRWDIRVSNSDISIKIKSGYVIVCGYFDKPYRHAAAIDLITASEGVKGINDRSQVLEDYFRTDKEIEILISKQILTLPMLQGEWIDVAVCDGVVKLEGQVFRPRYKAFAARATWELSGVNDCLNFIVMKNGPDLISNAQLLPYCERVEAQ